MTNQQIYITALDAEKIRKLLMDARATEYRNSPYLQMLSNELDRAMVVEPQQVPPDVITMNTQAALVDVETGEEEVYTLVYPEDADPIAGKISILAPIGTAMLGYRVGDAFEWDTPGGVRKMRVSKILYQPESSGDYQS